MKIEENRIKGKIMIGKIFQIVSRKDDKIMEEVIVKEVKPLSETKKRKIIKDRGYYTPHYDLNRVGYLYLNIDMGLDEIENYGGLNKVVEEREVRTW